MKTVQGLSGLPSPNDGFATWQNEPRGLLNIRTVVPSLALASAFAVAMAWPQISVAAPCTTSGSGIYTCTGSSSSTVTLTEPDNLDVNADASFGINATTGNGLELEISDTNSTTGDLSFTQAPNGGDISGDVGIDVKNTSAGDTRLDVSGNVTGNTGDGIHVESVKGGNGSMSITTSGNVTGASGGIFALQQSKGSFDLTATGHVKGNDGIGVQAITNTHGGMTVTVDSVEGATGGLDLQNYESRVPSFTGPWTSDSVVTTNGVISSSDGTAINLVHFGNDATITTKADVKGTTGIHVLNQGAGSTKIVSAATVEGTTGAGISVEHSVNSNPLVPAGRISSDIFINAHNVIGATDGIETLHGVGTTGITSITTTGTVTGTAGSGIETVVEDDKGVVEVTVGSDSLVEGKTAGVSFVAGGSASNLKATLQNNGTIQNLSGASADKAIISKTGYQAAITNNNTVIGTVDLATNAANQFDNQVGASWNTAGGSNELGTGSITNAGTVIAAASGATGTVNTMFNNVSSFTNSGSITMSNGVVGDVTTINGDYVGGGQLLVDSEWNDPDAQKNDLLIINGTASGNTTVSAPGGIIGDVTQGNVPKNGGWTDPVVTVNGSDADQTFTGTAATTNAGQAQLTHHGKSYYWTLTARKPGSDGDKGDVPILAPGVSGYVQMPHINREMGFSQMGQLHQRMGEQQTWAWDDCGALCADDEGKNKPTQWWGRLSFGELNQQGESRFGYESTGGFIQLGKDLDVKTSAERDHRHIGVMLTYSYGEHDFYDKYRAENGVISNDKHTGEGSTDMFSLGAYSTWYQSNGTYVDLVGNLSWIRNDYSSASGNASQDGYGIGASVEVGRPWQLGDSNWLLEPQAQLSYQYVNLDSFDDDVRNISDQDGGTLRGRLGLRLAWNADNGEQHTSTVYFKANLLHDFTGNDGEARIGADTIDEDFAATWGEIGVGSQFALSDALYLYGDVSYARSFNSDNQVYRSTDDGREAYSGRIGIRYLW